MSLTTNDRTVPDDGCLLADQVRRRAGREWMNALYAPIRDELVAFEDMLRSELQSDYPSIDELVKHGFRLGGKRLRPALLLLAAQAAGRSTREHLVLATVVEMIHTATLVHDDVLDDAVMRRHLETVNARWSNQSSVLLGDFLFSHAFYLASTLSSTVACQVIGRATNIVCEGELRQIHTQGNFALSETDYLSIIDAKTAELCACCCRLGAHYAGAEVATEDALARYGRLLGMSFQIVDDLLDLLGDEQTTGKSLGTDLAQQKLTLPLIRVLGQVEPAERDRLVAQLSGPDGDRRRILDVWFARTDALGYARNVAAGFAEQARAELKLLPPSPARRVLEQLTEFVVQREQ